MITESINEEKNGEKIREIADGILYLCDYATQKKIPVEILTKMIELKLKQLLSNAD